MNIEEVREYCLHLPATEECLPFDEYTLVFKVGNKMFALLNLDNTGTMNLKCDPEYAIEIREQYSSIIPGYHMNKTHWNTIYFEELDSKFLKELIHHSYNLVIAGLSKKIQAKLRFE
ncbi:MAG TPA: MmcQ/YjbR family DNA-binding protein [Bacteroidales bacterium]|mgnify:CR=1 FL=1|nr:MmcQ/YjbR family DNA-binding protein [Bacteroidales bacterium]